MDYIHNSVMPNEIIENLKPKSGGIYIDATLGGGGHSRLILENSPPNGKLLCIDQDNEAIENGKKILSDFKDRTFFHKGNFSSINLFAKESNFTGVDGIVADLGVSSHHLDTDSRGFSFAKQGPLDMRMDKSKALSAFEVVNNYSSEDLFIILKRYGDEKFASRIANAIVENRKNSEINTTTELAEIIKSAIPVKFSHKMKIHPATKSFMAIRIEVNKEMEVLENFLNKAPYLLNKGGRLCILTFHSLEDRLVKHKFRDLCVECTCPPQLPVCICNGKKEFKLVTRKPLIPSKKEVETNKRSRSTKLRVLEKL